MLSSPEAMNSVFAPGRRVVFVISLAAVVFTTLFIAIFRDTGPVQHQVANPDYVLFYSPVARHILEGQGIRRAQEVGSGDELATRYPPGFPVLLAGLFGISQATGMSEIVIIWIANIFFTTAGVVALYFLCQMFVPRHIAAGASLLWVIYPLQLWFTQRAHTEVPFVFLFYTSAWLYWSSLRSLSVWRMFGSGLFLGAAALVRPIIILLPVLWVGFIYWKKRELGRRCLGLCTIFLIGYIVVVSPWELHVYRYTHEIIPLATLGIDTIQRGIIYVASPGEAGNRLLLPVGVTAMIDRVAQGDYSSFGRIIISLSTEFFSDPISFMLLWFIKTVRAWFATSEKWYEWLTLSIQVAYLVPASIGALLLFRQRVLRPLLLWAALTIGYFWMMTTLTYPVMRYIIPTMGLIMLPVAVSIDMAWRRCIRRTPITENIL